METKQRHPTYSVDFTNASILLTNDCWFETTVGKLISSGYFTYSLDKNNYYWNVEETVEADLRDIIIIDDFGFLWVDSNPVLLNFKSSKLALKYKLLFG